MWIRTKEVPRNHKLFQLCNMRAPRYWKVLINSGFHRRLLCSQYFKFPLFEMCIFADHFTCNASIAVFSFSFFLFNKRAVLLLSFGLHCSAKDGQVILSLIIFPRHSLSGSRQTVTFYRFFCALENHLLRCLHLLDFSPVWSPDVKESGIPSHVKFEILESRAWNPDFIVWNPECTYFKGIQDPIRRISWNPSILGHVSRLRLSKISHLLWFSWYTVLSLR